MTKILATNIASQVFKTTIYESVIGKIEIWSECSIDLKTVFTTIMVTFPNGFEIEVDSIVEGFKELELEVF